MKNTTLNQTIVYVGLTQDMIKEIIKNHVLADAQVKAKFASIKEFSAITTVKLFYVNGIVDSDVKITISH